MNLLKIDNADAKLVPFSEKSMSEKSLEDLVEKNSHIILGQKLLIIGRQVKTDSGKILDLLAVDRKGRLVVIELKKGYAPREIIAQILDYSSWLSNVPERRIEDIARNYFQMSNCKYKSLPEAFVKFFDVSNCPEIGREVVNILFAKEFSEEVINPAKYLASYDLSIYCIRFEFFESNLGQYIVTDNIVGNFEEYYSDLGDVRNDKNDNRILIKQLVEFLQENCSKESSEIRFEKLYDFKLYQSKDGEYTCAYIDWVYDDGTKFAFEVGIYSSLEEGLKIYSYFKTRRRSEALLSKTKSTEVEELLLNSGYKDESENGSVYFGKFQSVKTISFDFIREFAEKEFSNIMKIIRCL